MNPFKCCLLIILFILIPHVSFAIDVILSWNANANTTGFKVYYRKSGTESFGDPIDVGNVLEYVITFTYPDDKGHYFFALTAYNEYGESGLSRQVQGFVGHKGVGKSIIGNNNLGKVLSNGGGVLTSDLGD